jgi:hypothetical protein
VEGRGRVTHVGIDSVNWQQEEPTGFGRRRQPSLGGTSRVSREAHARICERLGVKFPGATRLTLIRAFVRNLRTWVGSVKGKGTSGRTARSKVPMGQTGADCSVVCAEQRVVQEGQSPSGARMRGAISKRGGNASRAGEGGRYGDA